MPTATPESAVNKNYLGNEKDVGAVLFAYPVTVALVNLYARISNQLAHVKRYYIRVLHTQSIYNYFICKGGDRDIKSPTWTFRLRYLLA